MTHVCTGGMIMNRNKQIYSMVLTSLLIAIGIIIPMVSPIKVVIEPMSFTLASHVAIMIAMFISPISALAVAVGTTLGFFLAGFPIAVVLRALSHVVWAFAGSYYISKHVEIFESPAKSIIFNLVIAVMHAVLEMIVVVPFYMGTDANAFMYMVFGLVGVGTIVHSFVDFVISLVVWNALCKSESISKIANVKKVSLVKKNA